MRMLKDIIEILRGNLVSIDRLKAKLAACEAAHNQLKEERAQLKVEVAELRAVVNQIKEALKGQFEPSGN